jgi:hypothetical protein
VDVIYREHRPAVLSFSFEGGCKEREVHGGSESQIMEQMRKESL